MNAEDRDLGMDRPITRRDIVQGVAIGTGAMALAGVAPALAQPATYSPETAPDYYPPLRQGMRGSHPGSFEPAHQLRNRGGVIDISAAEHTGETYDLVVVGGGISGLSAAYFYLKNAGRGARVLVLDNHDDFGGHAKRNEFKVNGRTLAINGGTLNIESPHHYNKWAKEVLADIGVDLDRYVRENTSNRSLYSSLGLKRAHFFDRETWGADRLVVPHDSSPGRRNIYSPSYVNQMPISVKAKRDLLRLVDPKQPDYMPGLPSDEKKFRLATTSYKDFLLNIAKVDPQVLWFFQTTGHGIFCLGADAVPASFAWQMGAPGFSGMGLDPTTLGVLADLPGGQHGRQNESDGGGDIHFPDGNATVARLLVRWLIPDAVPGNTQESVGTAHVDYAKLDRIDQPARIRLNSIAVHVKHDGDPATAKEVVVTYTRGGKLYDVRGRAVIMAGWNMMIPYITPEIPRAQKEALLYGVKGPLVYTSVAIRNWTSFHKLGIRAINSPTMWNETVELTEAADLGDLHHPRTPEEPIALHLVKIMAEPGKDGRTQHRMGRERLLNTSFETFERNIRDQLGRILGPGGFDPARDIDGIMVNRWPHGYAYTYNSLFDPLEWVFTESETRPCVVARKPIGRISIANSDAAASPHTDAAMLEAHRAVTEVLDHRAWPFANELGQAPKIPDSNGPYRPKGL